MIVELNVEIVDGKDLVSMGKIKLVSFFDEWFTPWKLLYFKLKDSLLLMSRFFAMLTVSRVAMSLHSALNW